MRGGEIFMIIENEGRHIPRFHAKTEILPVPEGMLLVKFHGEPALIPQVENGDIMYGKSQFTERQVKALLTLEHQRIQTMQEQSRRTSFGSHYLD